MYITNAGAAASRSSWLMRCSRGCETELLPRGVEVIGPHSFCRGTFNVEHNLLKNLTRTFVIESWRSIKRRNLTRRERFSVFWRGINCKTSYFTVHWWEVYNIIWRSQFGRQLRSFSEYTTKIYKLIKPIKKKNKKPVGTSFMTTNQRNDSRIRAFKV